MEHDVDLNFIVHTTTGDEFTYSCYCGFETTVQTSDEEAADVIALERHSETSRG